MKTPKIRHDPRNARRRDDAARAAIRRSIEVLGVGRSIVIDRDGVVVAGNGVLEEARALGVPLKIIDSDGSELVAVRRSDMGTNDPQRCALALADNAVAALADWDEPTLAELRAELGADLEEVAGFGLDATGEDWAPPPPDDGERYDQCEKYGAVLRLGEYHCDVSREAYDRVIEEIRQEVGSDEAAVTAELLRRIGA